MVNILEKIDRDKRLVRLVLRRDIGLCRCCGFKGDEVHHIVPLSLGGIDEIENMITLCGECHRNAPNTLEEFKEYMRKGGSRLYKIIGKIVLDMEEKKVPFNEYYSLMLKVISYLRQVDINNAIETYGIKESLEIKDIKF